MKNMIIWIFKLLGGPMARTTDEIRFLKKGISEEIALIKDYKHEHRADQRLQYYAGLIQGLVWAHAFLVTNNRPAHIPLDKNNHLTSDN